MALTPSTMRLALGSQAPAFTLPDPSEKKHSLADFRSSKATVVLFTCNHCPYVVHLAEAIGKIADTYAAKGVSFVAINSNNIQTHPADAPALMPAFAEKYGWHFPYLFDESQDVAKAYHAACTPDFFVLDGQHKLFYRGQFDDSRPGNSATITGQDLKVVLDAVLSGAPAPANPKPSMGCNIKWKPGNEPA